MTESITTLEPEAEVVESLPTGLQRADTGAIINEYRAQLERLRVTAETITVTDVTDTVGQKLARETRLQIRQIRIASDKRRAELVEDMTKETRRINSGFKAIWDATETLEKRLVEQEKFIERENTRLAEERRKVRGAQLAEYQSIPTVDLATLTEAEFNTLLADAKDLMEMRAKREAEEKAAAEAKAKEEAEERARIKAENARLKAEAEAKAKEIAEEREREHAKAVAAAEEAARVLAESQAAAAAELAKVEAIRKQEQEEQRRLLAEAEAQREVERQIAAKAQADARAAQEAALAQERAREAQEIARLKAIADDERRKIQQAEEEARAAAAAPDKEKLLAFAASLEEIPMCILTTPEANAIVARIAKNLMTLVKGIRTAAAEL